MQGLESAYLPYRLRLDGDAKERREKRKKKEMADIVLSNKKTNNSRFISGFCFQTNSFPPQLER